MSLALCGHWSGGRRSNLGSQCDSRFECGSAATIAKEAALNVDLMKNIQRALEGASKGSRHSLEALEKLHGALPLLVALSKKERYRESMHRYGKGGVIRAVALCLSEGKLSRHMAELCVHVIEMHSMDDRAAPVFRPLLASSVLLDALLGHFGDFGGGDIPDEHSVIAGRAVSWWCWWGGGRGGSRGRRRDRAK